MAGTKLIFSKARKTATPLKIENVNLGKSAPQIIGEAF